MTTAPVRFTFAAAIILGFAAAAGAQPSFERTACLAMHDQQSAGLDLALAAADWDDDGRSELFWGTPHWDLDSESTSNGVFGVYEVDPFEPEGWGRLSWSGLTGSRQGWALAAGDFDLDGEPEIAFSAPRDVGGSVTVYQPLGGGGCCEPLGDVLRQGGTGIAGTSEEGDDFGFALAAGDFDDDGYADLAVGIPGEDWIFVPGEDQGAVHVFYGSPAGLDGDRDEVFGQNSFDGQSLEDGDRFGRVLAAGDLDGDGYHDLVIGVPHEDDGTTVDAGVAHVVFGGPSGLDFSRQQTWSQSSPGIAGDPETDDFFGWALAIGDFDRASLAPLRRELAISAPCEPDGAFSCAGAVHVLYTDADGPTATGSQLLRRPGGSDTDVAFGTTLLAAALDGDKVWDLLVAAGGALYATPPGFAADGELHLFYGRLGGQLRASGLGPIRPLAGACFDSGVSAYDFGDALAFGDFDDDGEFDLAIGIDGWTDSGSVTAKGAALVLFGSDALFRDGFDTGDLDRWSAATP